MRLVGNLKCIRIVWRVHPSDITGWLDLTLGLTVSWLTGTWLNRRKVPGISRHCIRYFTPIWSVTHKKPFKLTIQLLRLARTIFRLTVTWVTAVALISGVLREVLEITRRCIRYLTPIWSVSHKKVFKLTIRTLGLARTILFGGRRGLSVGYILRRESYA